jgi:type VI secretion system protein ImpI
MRLTLKIENHDRLPDGGPLSVTVAWGRRIDVGRDQYLDWTLPDPDRYISGKHFEIRSEDGQFLLYDVSRNGTFVNGSERRVQSPYRLRNGDRLTIGQYIIAATIDEDRPAHPAPPGVAHRPVSYDELWDAEGQAPPPIPAGQLRPPLAREPAYGDWIERRADFPSVPPKNPNSPRGAAVAPAASPDLDADWAPLAPKGEPLPPQEPQPPNPRRAFAAELGEPWSEDPGVLGPQPAMPENPGQQEEPRPADRREVSQADGFDQFLAAFAAAAGTPPAVLMQQSPQELGERLGALIGLLTVEMKQLLDARNETRRRARSRNQTMIQAQGNNPLKFSPTAEDALRIMLGPPMRAYMDAPSAFAQGFQDLKTHQLMTFAAMQQALRKVADDLDPATIEKSVDCDGGFKSLLSSRKARLWEAYALCWQVKVQHHDDGLLGVFMNYFSQCYDDATGER